MTGDPRDHFGPVHIEQPLAQHVACLRLVSGSPEEEAAEAMRQWLGEQGLAELAELPYFGFDVEVNAEEQAAGLRGYEVWYPVPEIVRPSGRVTTQDFGGGLYAVMRLVSPFADPFGIIPAGWQQLVAWAESNDRYVVADGPCLERLIPDPDGPHLDLYLAVAEKRT